MPSQQQLVLEPLGLVTEPNKLGQIPAGALSVMTDCVERSPGVIENIQAWQIKVTVSGTDGGTTAMFAVPMDGNRVVVIYNVTAGWKYRWYDLSTGSALYAAQDLSFVSGNNTLPQSILLTEQPGFSAVRYGTQTFINAFSNVLVWDDPTAATLASSLVRPAGLQRPQLIGGTVLSGSAGTALPVRSYANYVAVNTRTINGRKVLSAPSAAMSLFNANPTVVSTRLDFKLRAGDQVAGDVLELYRTPTKPSGVTASFQQFQAGEEAGAEYRRVTSYTITTSDLAGSILSIFDDCPDTSLGEALYTNQSNGSVGAAAETPPAVELLTAHKGFLFGFSTTYAPEITLRPTGLWGGFDSTQTTETVLKGFGSLFTDVSLTGASYSSGSTTINVSPTSQLQYLSVGMYATGTSFAGVVKTIGGSSFTIDVPTTGAVSGDSWQAFDTFGWTDGSTIAFNTSWYKLVNSILASSVTNSDLTALRAQSLKLPPFTPSQFTAAAVGFPSQPTDGFDIYVRFLEDSRPNFGVNASKGTSWDPQIPNFSTGTYKLATEQKFPRSFVWSEQDTPESWPFVNEDSFSRGTACAIASTADAMIAFYTDAIWRVSGTGGNAAVGANWRSDPLATGITPIGSQAIAVLLDKVYSMTSEGLIVIPPSGQIQNITQGRVHDQLSTPPWNNGPFSLSTAAFVVEDEEHDEILMREPSASAGKMWIYNTHTDRLSQTTSHAEPMTAFYSRALRSPVVVGRDAGTTWTLKAQTGGYGNFALTYARVYADNPFAQRHWQTLNVSAETAGATVATTFNGVAGPSRTLDADGRAGFEVPIDAPAIGNTMEVGLSITTSARTKLHGFALDYRDHTERRRTR